jgi:DNA repair exonuclease SbcCD ATPase subunit
MDTKVNLGKNAQVCVKWNVLPVDRTDEKEEIIKAMIAEKYGINKANVEVTPVYRSMSGNQEDVLVNEVSQNIQDPIFQQSLFKPFLESKGIEDYDYDKIIEIDNLINSTINYELYDKHKKYTFKWIKWSNFMSYGPDNYFDFTTLKDLVLLSSIPANQGGKTTFCLDLLRFLLFGKVTSRENDWTLARVFNDHIPEATEVLVEGCIMIDGVDYVIKRVITRPTLAKRTNKSKVTQKLNYYKLINGQYVDLIDEDAENLEGSTNTETNKLIKEAIGNERDFDLMICVSSDNLKGLISLKDTDRGRLMARWIGLLPVEEKDKNAREWYNKKVQPTLLLNKYNKIELQSDVKELGESNKEYQITLKTAEEKKKESEKKLEELKQNKDALLQSKRQIDASLTKVDITTVKQENERLTNEGITKKAKNESDKKEYESIKDVQFNMADYENKLAEDKQLSIELNNDRNDCKRIRNEIDALKKGEFCPTCGARLKDVDNSAKISQKEKEFNVLAENGKKKKEKLEALQKEIEELKKINDVYNKKLRLELIIEKNNVDLENLRNKIKDNKRLIADIQANEDAIIANNKIDAAINVAKANIAAEEQIRDTQQSNIEAIKAQIKTNEEKITTSEKIIATIEKEEELVKAWKIYLEIIGKNGISKMVLRNALPLINSELRRLLNGVCNFSVEVGIDDSNDVMFYEILDGVKRSLGAGSGFEQTAASLALRSVLSEISTFSKPSFVIFDEILGGVADENYDNMKLLYDKIAKNYAFVLQISHLKALSDWHSANIIVKKENNISKIERA